MLDLKRLRLLWELHHRGTVAAVAKALNYSPSAVSQQLAVLEREAGVPLMRRTGRTLTLTAPGEVLVGETEQLLAGLERAESALHRARDVVGGTLRVAAFQTAMISLMPGALRRLRHDYPELRVEVVHYEPGEALQETWGRGFDLVVAEQYPGHSTEHFPGLERQLLLSDPIRLAVPPRGVGEELFDDAEKLEDFRDLPWVMEPQGAATRHWAEQACRLAGFEPDVRYETADLRTHIRFIETGNAAALLPGLLHQGVAGRVRLIDLPGEPRRTIFTAARAAQSAHPAVEAVRAALAVEAADLTSELSSEPSPEDS
ncbi:MAG: LysR family transcriptional regulator [Micrococcaceae bacterium]